MASAPYVFHRLEKHQGFPSYFVFFTAHSLSLALFLLPVNQNLCGLLCIISCVLQIQNNLTEKLKILICILLLSFLLFILIYTILLVNRVW